MSVNFASILPFSGNFIAHYIYYSIRVKIRLVHYSILYPVKRITPPSSKSVLKEKLFIEFSLINNDTSLINIHKNVALANNRQNKKNGSCYSYNPFLELHLIIYYMYSAQIAIQEM